jgi:hypothetical protein
MAKVFLEKTLLLTASQSLFRQLNSCHLNRKELENAFTVWITGYVEKGTWNRFTGKHGTTSTEAPEAKTSIKLFQRQNAVCNVTRSNYRLSRSMHNWLATKSLYENKFPSSSIILPASARTHILEIFWIIFNYRSFSFYDRLKRPH